MKHTNNLLTRSFLFNASGVLIFMLAFNSLSAQYITTVIGNGVSACFIDNLPPLCLPVSYPQSVCVAANDDIYFTCNNSVKKLSRSTGLVTRVAGTDTYQSSGNGGPAIDALFQGTRVVRMDRSGNLYVAEGAGNRVRKINLTTGIITAYAGNGTAGSNGDGGLAVNAQINAVWDMAIDNAGNVFLAEYYGNRIRKIDALTGVISTYAGTGAASSSGDGGLAVNAGVFGPTSVCLDAKGNVYFAEDAPGTGRVRKINATTGIITTIAGNNSRAHSGDGGPAADASLLEPTGVIVDADGNIYIGEYVDSRIRKIDARTGVINTIVGTGVIGFSGDNGLAVNAKIEAPLGMSFDNQGDLLFCDSRNLRIRKLYTNAAAPPTGSPTIAISSPTTTACSGSSITFTAKAAYTVAGYSFVWTKNGQTVGTDSAQWTATDLVAGDVIMCTLPYPVCGGTTKVQSNKITITGSSSLPMSVSISANRTTICKNDTVVFDARVENGSPSQQYRWMVNNVDMGVNAAVFKSAAIQDGDIVSCEVEVASIPPCAIGSLARSNSVKINVRSLLPPSVNVSPSAVKSCAGKEVAFTASLQNADTSYSIQWKVNGVDVGTNSPNFRSNTLADHDEVSCLLSSQTGCTKAVLSNIIKMEIESPPSVRILPVDTIVSMGSTVQLNAVVSGVVSSYVWTPSVYLDNAGTLRPVTIPLQKTTQFTLMAISPGNCVDSSKAIIRVEQKLFMPNAFTPNNDARNDVYRIPPNTTLQLKNFSIFNMWGERIFSTDNMALGWDGTVHGKAQNGGTYIYVVMGSDANGPIYLKGTFLLIR